VFGEDLDVGCDGPEGKPSQLAQNPRFHFVRNTKQQQLPGGEVALVAVGFFFYYPLGTLLAFLAAWSTWGADRKAAKLRIPQLAATEADFVRRGGDLDDPELVPRLQASRAIWTWIFLLLPLLLMGACAGVNLGLRTP